MCGLVLNEIETNIKWELLTLSQVYLSQTRCVQFRAEFVSDFAVCYRQLFIDASLTANQQNWSLDVFVFSIIPRHLICSAINNEGLQRVLHLVAFLGYKMMLIELLDRDLLKIIALETTGFRRKRNEFFENSPRRARTRTTCDDDIASERNQQTQKRDECWRLNRGNCINVSLRPIHIIWWHIWCNLIIFQSCFAAQFIFIHLRFFSLRLIHNRIYFILFFSAE